MTRAAPRKARSPKTPRQRAEEALGVAQRRVEGIERQLKDARAALGELVAREAEAQRRLEYAQADPALRDDTIPGTDAGNPEE